MNFIKMHGCGNSYIFIYEKKIDSTFNYSELAKKISNPCFGIGSDGLIIISDSNTADYKMTIYNKDGSIGKMCGNGIRCVAKYIYEYLNFKYRYLYIETDSGIHLAMLSFSRNGEIKSVTIDMGSPNIDNNLLPKKDYMIDSSICAGHYISLGNEHLIFFNEELDKILKCKEISTDYPLGINISTIVVNDNSNITANVYERGSGKTMACGTAACACAFLCIKLHLTKNDVVVHLPGGNLTIHYNSKLNKVFLSGECITICTGTF